LQKGESAQLMAEDHFSSKPLDAQRQADTSKAFENSTVSESDPANLTKDLSKIESIEAQKPNKEEAPPALENSDIKSTLDQEEEAKETAVSTFEDSKDTSSGMKSATFEGDMVSLTTFEDIQTSSAPAAVSEPSITSANRLPAMAGLSERTAIRSIENTGSGADNPSGNFSTGNPALIPIGGNSAIF
jgi:hypothetical protein